MYFGVYISAVRSYISEDMKILRTRLKKDMVVLEISRKFAMDKLDSEMVFNDKEIICEFEGKKTGWTCDLHG